MTQIEKNKEILICEIEKYSMCPMTDSVAEHLSVYRNALKALCMLEKHDEPHEAEEYKTTAYIAPRVKQKLTQQEAEAWMAHLINADGTEGAHWTRQQTDQVLTKYGLPYDSVVFWAVMNSIYSDDVNVAKAHNVNTMDYYVDRVKAWLDDTDANQDKAVLYYQSIVRH